MNNPTKTLPERYHKIGEINLKKNKQLAVTLNIASFFLFVCSIFLLSNFTAFAHPEISNISGKITLGMITVLAGLVFLVIIVHELIHGLFYWFFTRSKPAFGFHLFYAFASAPEWYLPNLQFAITTFGPLIIIGIVGLVLILMAPLRWIVFIIFFLALNIAGSAGDLYILSSLFKLSPAGLINDARDVITFHEYGATTNCEKN